MHRRLAAAARPRPGPLRLFNPVDDQAVPHRAVAAAAAHAGGAGRARGLRLPSGRPRPTPPRPGALYQDGPSGPLPGRRHLVPARRPANRGARARLAAHARARRLARDDGPERRQRGRLLRAQLPRRRLVVPQGLRAAARAAGVDLGPALRVGQLPRDGVAERPPARRPRRRLPAVRVGAPRRVRRRGTNRLVVRVDSRRGELDVPRVAVRAERPLRRRLVELRRHPARGLPAEGSTPRLRRTSNVRPDAALPARARRPSAVDARSSATTRRAGATRVVEGTDRRPQIAFTARHGRAGRRLPASSAARRGSTSRGSGARGAQPLPRSSCAARRTAGRSSATRCTPASAASRSDGDGRMLLNGRPVDLRGREHARGRPRAAARRSARPSCAATSTCCGTSAQRSTRAHYPLHPLTLELADRYGILVWSEVPVYQMADAPVSQGRGSAARRSRMRARRW